MRLATFRSCPEATGPRKNGSSKINIGKFDVTTDKSFKTYSMTH